MMLELIDEHGHKSMQSRRSDIERMIEAGDATPSQVDDWHRVQMESVEEMKDLFVEPFYFGCEADDPMNAWAFNSKVTQWEPV